jgi:hypothetical protein
VTFPVMSDGGQALLEGLRVVAGDLLMEAGARVKTSIAAGEPATSPGIGRRVPRPDWRS